MQLPTYTNPLVPTHRSPPPLFKKIILVVFWHFIFVWTVVVDLQPCAAIAVASPYKNKSLKLCVIMLKKLPCLIPIWQHATAYTYPNPLCPTHTPPPPPPSILKNNTGGVMTLFRWFIFVWTVVLDLQPCAANAVVSPYKNKSLKLCDNA